MCIGGILGGVWGVGVLVVVVVRVGIMGHGVTDDPVEEMVCNGICHGGWWRWVEEGYIVVGFGWARVGVRGFAVGAHLAGAW